MLVSPLNQVASRFKGGKGYDKDGKKEEEKIIKENPHLQKYLDELQSKMDRPIFYSKLPRDLRGENTQTLSIQRKGLCLFILFERKTWKVKSIMRLSQVLMKMEK